MGFIGHTHTDILKVDIESWEVETLKTLVSHYLTCPSVNSNWRFTSGTKALKNLGVVGAPRAGRAEAFMTEPNMVYLNYNKHGTPDWLRCVFVAWRMVDQMPLGAQGVLLMSRVFPSDHLAVSGLNLP